LWRSRAPCSASSEPLARSRVTDALFLAFAAICLLLSAIGLYGVVTAHVVEGTRDVGIRMALGAPKGLVLRSVLLDGAWVTLIGLVIGATIAALLSSWLETILYGVSRHDPATFAAVTLLIYRRTIRPLYAYVSRRVGGNVSLAEDLVQETWLRAVRAWPARGVPAEPLAWLIRVARNILISHFRRVSPDLVEPAQLDRVAQDPSAAAELPEAASVINWGLTRLRRAHAEILEDFYFAGKSVRDIARERAVSERAIEGRLRRAREKLRRHIASRVPGHLARRPH
jgi:RNA polymerase sigma factor (sigma-70 family)